ncbi:MAG: radical SAM protein [Geobacteraceae bacterium]|nr:radical SAM protein [Geobacteraceae bacterium]
MNRLSFEKVFYHTKALNSFLDRGDCYPVHMIVGLTNCCNHACIWCYGYDTISAHYNDNDFAPPAMIINTVKEAAQLGLKAITLVGTGEPTLHPDFAAITREIKAARVDVGLFTNGSVLNEEKMQAVIDTHTFMRLSCSAADQEEHNAIHHAGRPGNDFNRIVSNVATLLAKRGGRPFPTIGVQFSVSHHNWQSLEKACRFWKMIGVDYFALKPVYKNPAIMAHEENEVPLDQVLKLMEETKQQEDDSFKVYAKLSQFDRVLNSKGPRRGYSKCHGQAFTTFLDPDGKLYVCGNMHGKDDFCIGNVMETGSFQSVWDGQRRRELLQRLDVSSCPIGCRMDPLNLIIADLLSPNPQNHPNFL